MTAEEFLKEIKKLGISLYYEHQPPKKPLEWKLPVQIKKASRDKISLENFFYVEEIRISGSDWCGNFESSEPVDLNIIFSHFCKNITYFQYRDLISNIVKIKETPEQGYYGEWTHYVKKKVVLQDLYNKMIEMKLIC